MSAEWTRVLTTTIHDYVKGEEVNILRNRKFLGLLKQKGRIEFNHSGDKISKRVRYKRAPMVGYSDGQTLTFTRRDRWKITELDWRGYSTTDGETKKERLMNRGKEQIIDVYTDLAKAIVDDIEDQFGEEFYIDGNAAANIDRMHGIESFFGNSGASPAGYVGLPSSAYASLNTDLASYGGAWATSGGSSTWPIGTGDAHYDFWSPLIVDYTDTLWGGTTEDWAHNCEETLRFGILHAMKNASKKGQLSYVQLERELYRKYLQSIAGRQTIFVNRNEDIGLVSLGFKDVTNFEGVEMTTEYGMPSGVGYGLNLDQMVLMSLQDRMFVVDGPTYDQESKTWRTSADFFGNLWCNPRFQVKWMSIT